MVGGNEAGADEYHVADLNISAFGCGSYVDSLGETAGVELGIGDCVVVVWVVDFGFVGVVDVVPIVDENAWVLFSLRYDASVLFVVLQHIYV